MTALLIDNFAGAGGASTGIEMAMGRDVDVAINHNEAAIAVHAANHPCTKHYCQSIYSIDPLDATEGRPVLLAWFSPDCKHHSKAKGGKPREKYIRDMAHVVPHWIERLKKATAGGKGAPQVIMLENVEEFREWGPLDDEGKPIKERKGEEFNLWVRAIRKNGYKVEWRELVACNYGTPTTRKRLFLIARRDGLPIVWPEPTHAPADPAVRVKWAEKLRAQGFTVENPDALPHWRTAAECIDWTIPCPSIFDRKRPLKDATCRRIAAGVMRYVVNAAKPFIVSVAHGDSGGRRTYPTSDPLGTVTVKGNAHAVSSAALVKLRNNGQGEDIAKPLGVITSGGLHHGLIGATLVQTGYGEREGQAPRALDPAKPLGTIVAGGAKHGLAAVHMEKFSENSRGKPADEPLDTVMAGAPRHGKIAAFLAQHNTERGTRGNPGRAADAPMSTVTQRGTQQQPVQVTLVEAGALPAEVLERAQMVAAFLVKYYGSEVGQHQAIDAPIDTITSKPRFAVVTVTIDTQTFIIADIGMRMLTPRELATAQGFPLGYVLDPECHYRTEAGNLRFGRLPKTHQISGIGNSVCPPLAAALCRANLAHAIDAAESVAA